MNDANANASANAKRHAEPPADATCRGYLFHPAGAAPPATTYRHATGHIYDERGQSAGVIVERLAVCGECAQQIDSDGGGVCCQRH
jgi:hypothetical protein